MDQPNFREISLAELGDKLDGAVALLDVLPAEHFERRHIPRAQNACVYQVDFLDAVTRLFPDKSAPLVISGAGAGAHDALVAAQKLTRAGYANLTVFPGGIEAAALAGLALEGTAALALDPPYPEFSPQPRTYSLVDGQGCIGWTGRNPNVSHHGRLSLARGQLDCRSDIRGSFEIDMKSIVNTNLQGDPLKEVLEAHLASDDFFFVSLFPTALFTLTRATPDKQGSATRPNYSVAGKLALRGLEKSLSFPAHFRMLADGRLGLHAHFDFDRTDWGVIYGSARFFRHLGMHVVYDHISLEISMILA